MSWLSCRAPQQAKFSRPPRLPPGAKRRRVESKQSFVCPCKHARAVCTHAETSGGFGEGLKRFGKQVQGAMPIVGLFSRLAAPDGGGFDEQTYPEYCRAKLEEGNIKLNCATADLNAAKGQVGSRKIVLFLTWMIRQGCGLLPDQYFILAARRLTASMDLEAEMYRFESSLEVEREKYSLMEPPISDREKQVVVAVDAVSTCCLGLRDGAEVPQEDSPLLLDVISATFPEVAESVVESAIKQKIERKYA